MDEQRRQKLGQPPGICDKCWNNNQQFHISDKNHECFYCSKFKAMAMPNAAGTGWCIFTGVSREEYLARADRAALTEAGLQAKAKGMH